MPQLKHPPLLLLPTAAPRRWGWGKANTEGALDFEAPTAALQTQRLLTLRTLGISVCHLLPVLHTTPLPHPVLQA